MKSTFISSVMLAIVLPGAAMAEKLALAFVPPMIERTEICVAPPSDLPPEDLEEGREEDELTNNQRIRFLKRDIRRFKNDDADRWFDFIVELLGELERADHRYDSIDLLFGRIDLHIMANRISGMQAASLIETAFEMRNDISKSQLLTLAYFYINGTGVEQNIELGQSLLRDAALGGNPDALFSLAELQINGKLLPEWSVPLDLTVTLAMSGILGEMDYKVCRRAERIAEIFRTGKVVAPNPELAMLWTTFSADLGSASAAWRIVEHHMNAEADVKDNEIMLHYLRLAVVRGIGVDPSQAEQLKVAGDLNEEELIEILGFNFSEESGRDRPALSTYFRLTVNIDGEEIDGEGPYLKYLREISLLEHVPGEVFLRLGREVLIRYGRWAGEAEAIHFFERAAAMGEPEAMRLLAKKLLRYRDDPSMVERSVNLLTESVLHFGLMKSMSDLDGVYRCQLNSAPHLGEANYWRENYRATEDKTPVITPGDLIAIGPHREPEVLGKIQSLALTGRVQAMAFYLERLQRSKAATTRADAFWAQRANSSDQTLEAFVELEFALARNPVERDRAIELFRRVYLNNGVTTALDLAIALVEHNGRDNEIALEIIDLLNRAAHRGEGASIRLMSRLLADERSEASIYEEFEQVIEDRGDFLALMFAVPHLPESKLDDYIDRAVSLMNCGTKDADEIGDAYAIWRMPGLSYHWRDIGLHFEGGHTLSRLRLSVPQMAMFEEGVAPNAVALSERALAEGNTAASFDLYRLYANTDLESYDPQKAAEAFLSVVAHGHSDDNQWLLEKFRLAPPDISEIIRESFDINRLFMKAAADGGPDIRFEYGMFLRHNAQTSLDLVTSIEVLKQAAVDGSVLAMREYGRALAYGIGVPHNRSAGALWLSQAANLDDQESATILRTLMLNVNPDQGFNGSVPAGGEILR